MRRRRRLPPRTRRARSERPPWLRLPPTTLRGISTYFRRRGYEENPGLEFKRGADITFAKPLPDGRRIHIRIYEGRKNIYVERHIDKADPKRDPIKHFVEDVLIGGSEHEMYKIPKLKARHRKRRAARSA